MKHTETPLLYEMSVPGRTGTILPKLDVPETALPKDLVRDDLGLPELDELSVVRHFTRLSQKNFSVDGQFYPLGSCTMKYNPKMNEDAAALPGFRRTHPLLPETMVQGAAGLLFKLQEALKEIMGYEAFTLQPAAGAQGELTGVLMIRAYHQKKGDTKRVRMLIPDSAHGTNPATCTMAGFVAETIPSNASGAVDMDALKAACEGEKAETVAGLMITNPSTLGLFEPNIREIIDLVHKAGGLVYGDGANMNALMGIVKPGQLGFDVMHLNLHKTFSTPHGGGGPGSGAVGAGPALKDFLPGPVAQREGGRYSFMHPRESIGRMKTFNGNFSVLVKTYAYIRTLGKEGIRRAAEYAVLNANYLKELVKENYPVAYGQCRPCMHEFVASPDLGNGVNTVDIAKRLIDYGFHPPTVYFPLIVKEAFMAEPTETETPETLEAFAAALKAIAEEARTNPEILKSAPHHTPVRRLDETAAARKPVLRYKQQ
ncbi:aminomethyl-transferring glycine dehydrogenase subunit GcvPB [Breznakiella homolactica]|uniref:Probable glycine dehydrogenase (decarboxylating) subunit 2 n=1 Tax=Breznakiella homolactica TaxID=2798577 RepID=A0A7T8BBU8_9SPIR|nr:aminomethyl-transferring glycine dehydrogenase subunit GcvPB [Breznakiella homolactica]QQO10952.1 aminomethyl-transferring glycine dehydrogenase subunit GcvPB [Breznakiella homolactica]